MVVVNSVMETIDRMSYILNLQPTILFRISQPKKIDSLKNIRISQISSANGCESLALISSEGKLFTCGYNNYGQLGHATQSNLSTPTLVNAIRETSVINVSCSYYHSLIVT